MNMSCHEIQAFIDGFVDGEFDLADSSELDRHMHECLDCRALYEGRIQIRSAIRAGSLGFTAPSALRTRVHASMTSIDNVESRRQPNRLLVPWVTIAAVFMIAILVGIRWLSFTPNTERAEVVDSHIRSLMVNHIVDVASTDQHTVKPWFAGKLDFSPPVGDFTSEGFTLVGGRLEYINHHPVAAIVYRRNQHIVNAFIWPVRSNSSGFTRAFDQGYYICETNHAGLYYYIVSDLNADELTKLAALLTRARAE